LIGSQALLGKKDCVTAAKHHGEEAKLHQRLQDADAQALALCNQVRARALLFALPCGVLCLLGHAG
jgi:hypothetical protein